jgi:hypothetical protein
MMNDRLRRKLKRMAKADLNLRSQLASSGALFEGYNATMQAMHERNADQLLALLDTTGWPRVEAVGADGVAAAWLIVQHAISRPDLQRRVLALLMADCDSGVTAAQVAMLQDRTCCQEGRPQIYGTQFDWDANGQLSPLPIADLDRVDERRAAVGLGPLAARIQTIREEAALAGQVAPEDWEQRQREQAEWLRSVGWRE